MDRSMTYVSASGTGAERTRSPLHPDRTFPPAAETPAEFSRLARLPVLPPSIETLPRLPKPPGPPDPRRVVITVHPPPRLGPGGLAGHAGEAQLRARIGGATLLPNVLNSPQLFRTLRDHVSKHGGKPLREITISSHGAGPAAIAYEKYGVKVSDLAGQLVARGLLAKGGTLVLTGCEVAKGRSGYDELRKAAADLGITIKANDLLTVFNSDTLMRWVFPPKGQPYRESALDPRNRFR